MGLQAAHRKPIVVGVHHGSGSTVALSWAAREAALADRPLYLVYAQTEPYAALLAGGVGLSAPPEPGERRETATALLNKAVDAAHTWEPGIDIMATAQIGDPTHLLLARSRSAAMVVLGNHGASLLHHLMLRSVCGIVAANAPCLVIATNGRPAWPDAPIVVGVDRSGVAGDAIEFAFDLAARRSVPVRAHHVRARTGSDLPADVRRRLAAASARHPAATVSVSVSTGNPVTGLIEAAAEAQLLVVGARRHGPAVGLITGSVSHGLLRRAPCSLAVVGRGCFRTPDS